MINNRPFSRDVTSAISVSLENKMAACWCPKLILSDLKHFSFGKTFFYILRENALYFRASEVPQKENEF